MHELQMCDYTIYLHTKSDFVLQYKQITKRMSIYKTCVRLLGQMIYLGVKVQGLKSVPKANFEKILDNVVGMILICENQCCISLLAEIQFFKGSLEIPYISFINSRSLIWECFTGLFTPNTTNNKTNRHHDINDFLVVYSSKPNLMLTQCMLSRQHCK